MYIHRFEYGKEKLKEKLLNHKAEKIRGAEYHNILYINSKIFISFMKIKPLKQYNNKI